MSRATAYQDPRYSGQDDPFDLPLFNPHPPPALSPIRMDLSPAAAHHAQLFPSQLPAGSGHQQRHSVAAGNTYDLDSPFNGSSPQFSAAPQMQHHVRQGSMSSALPYTSPYSQQQELMPPPTASTSFSLGRSASLGTRRRDPYSYSSDDVESGLGNMDMGAEPWQNYGEYGNNDRGRHLQPNQVQGHGSRDIVMSPTRPSPNRQMNPPPAPALNFPSPRLRDDSRGSSPSGQQYNNGHSRDSSTSNPYIPRGSDPGPSAGSQWTEYRPSTGSRMTSTTSFDHSSPIPQQHSPYLKPELPPGPRSPLTNPYDASPTTASTAKMPTSSLGTSNWQDSGLNAMPISPPAPQRAKSSQTYPASQPVTPAARGTYDMAPPRGLPTRTKSGGAGSRTGFRDVTDYKDLRPVLNALSAGRRADPDAPGKYLSVSRVIRSRLSQLTSCSLSNA